MNKKSGIDFLLGIFDGNHCVGSAQIVSDQILSGWISIPASCNDGMESASDGFIPDNPVTILLFRNNQEYLLKPELLNNSKSTFGKDESMFARVKTEIASSTIDLNEPVSVKCYPNPFSNQVNIEIQLAEPQELVVTVYDITGKLVRRLFKGEAEGGKVLVWAGKNDLGARMTPGMYFCHANEIVTKIIYTK